MPLWWLSSRGSEGLLLSASGISGACCLYPMYEVVISPNYLCEEGCMYSLSISPFPGWQCDTIIEFDSDTDNSALSISTAWCAIQHTGSCTVDPLIWLIWCYFASEQC